MTKSLTTPQLTEHCQDENTQYLKTGQSGQYCFALFNRALIEDEEQAWAAICKQYQKRVYIWVRKYTLFPGTGEDPAYFINEAFFRLWRYGSKVAKAGCFDDISKYMQYLRMCTHSAIEAYYTQNKIPKPPPKSKDDEEIPASVGSGAKVPSEQSAQFTSVKASTEVDELDEEEMEDRLSLITIITLEEYHQLLQSRDKKRNLEEDVLNRLFLQKIFKLLFEITQNQREYIIARESWEYGMPPRAILSRYPQLFDDANDDKQTKKNIADINQIKRNVKDRFQRKIRKMLKETVKDKAEKVVFVQTWTHKRSPAQIQASHSALFETIERVEHIKNTLIQRLEDKL